MHTFGLIQDQEIQQSHVTPLALHVRGKEMDINPSRVRGKFLNSPDC